LVYPNKAIDLDIPPEMKDETYRSEVYQWGQTCASLEVDSLGFDHWWSLTCDWYASPLAGVEFDSFRRLGFALWDKKRMYFLGVLPGPKRGVGPKGDESQYFFAWESILPVEEVKRVTAELQKQVKFWWVRLSISSLNFRFLKRRVLGDLLSSICSFVNGRFAS
jgi:hypothetical protein